jgi:hypothetical protein
LFLFFFYNFSFLYKNILYILLVVEHSHEAGFGLGSV